MQFVKSINKRPRTQFLFVVCQISGHHGPKMRPMRDGHHEANGAPLREAQRLRELRRQRGPKLPVRPPRFSGEVAHSVSLYLSIYNKFGKTRIIHRKVPAGRRCGSRRQRSLPLQLEGFVEKRPTDQRRQCQTLLRTYLSKMDQVRHETITNQI